MKAYFSNGSKNHFLSSQKKQKLIIRLGINSKNAQWSQIPLGVLFLLRHCSIQHESMVTSIALLTELCYPRSFLETKGKFGLQQVSATHENKNGWSWKLHFVFCSKTKFFTMNERFLALQKYQVILFRQGLHILSVPTGEGVYLITGCAAKKNPNLHRAVKKTPLRPTATCPVLKLNNFWPP